MIDAASPKFQLPFCLRVPIAARDVVSVETYVGAIDKTIVGRGSRVRAVRVRSHISGIPCDPTAPLWRRPDRSQCAERLFPEHQIWVHVDYRGYRSAYRRLEMPGLADGEVLDHIQNRRAMRLRLLSHPWLRLCPVSQRVNTNAGHRSGAEGMEVQHLYRMRRDDAEWDRLAKWAATFSIIYADPIDLTKMLDMSPGTMVLDGVRDVLGLFYP